MTRRVHFNFRRAAALLLACALPLLTSAQEASNEAPRWLRYPAISPDGSQIAFAYAGQIWLVPAAGGEAVPLTAAPFYSSHPVWSPDGKRIAFSADRHGNADVFVMPATGGAITRLTYHSQADVPVAFSADGAQVYFNSARLGDPRADAVDAQKGVGIPYLPQLYSVPAQGGRSRLVLATLALDLSPSRDGKRMLYTSTHSVVENEWRKHQVSDAARDIWLYEPGSGKHRQLTEWRGEDRNAVFSPDGSQMLWLSEQSGSFNVWRRGVTSGDAEQLTFHERWPVRFLSSADDGTLAYAFDGGIWRLPPGAAKPEQVAVRIRQGNLIDGKATVAVNNQVSEISLSPNGKELAMIARGEVFVVSLASGATRRITSTAGMERFVSFAPDGRRLLYASARNGDWDIFEARLSNAADQSFIGDAAIEEVERINEQADVYQPLYSPDGRKIAYLSQRTALRVLDTTTGKSVEVMPRDAAYSYKDGDMGFAWGADSRWLVVRSGFGPTSEIELLDAEGVKPRQNISLNGFSDQFPQVSRDGSIVYWGSDRKGLRAANADGVQQDVYAAFLTQQAFDQYRATADERLRLEAAQQASSATPPADKTAPLPGLEGLEFRTAALTPFSSELQYFQLSPDNKRLVLVAMQNKALLAGFAIDLATHTAKQLFSVPVAGSPAFAMDDKATALYLVNGPSITRYDLGSGTPSPVRFRAEVVRDVRQEVSAIFEQDWRATRETFYRSDMQGADWQAIGDHYRQFLPHIVHWEDLAELLSEMVGELNASHQGSRYTPARANGDQTASLGLYYDQTHAGPGVRIAAVLPGGPADRPASALVAGAVILAVDDQKIGPDSDIDPFLNRKTGQPVRLTIQPSAGDKVVEQTVLPVGLLEENELAYVRWVAKRRTQVERLSKGRIGYIHVRGMSLAPYQQAYGELFGRYRDAEAVIVDIRCNGGGNLHDQLNVLLTGNHDSSLVSRDGVEVVRNPVGRFARPSALLVNANSYSDASVFPTLYQQKKLGALIGERVPGTGTAVVDVAQVEPRLGYRVPELGFRLNDGRWFENMEVVPDVLVYNDPESVAAGRDLQLEQAVEHLLKVIAQP